MPQKTIISCAITGAVHTPTMSQYLPVHPDTISEQAIAAAEAGGYFRARAANDGYEHLATDTATVSNVRYEFKAHSL